MNALGEHIKINGFLPNDCIGRTYQNQRFFAKQNARRGRVKINGFVPKQKARR